MQGPSAVSETRAPETPKPRLLDQVRTAIRARHYSRRTEDAYVAWIRRYIVFPGRRHPAEMSAPQVSGFLTALAVDGKVASSTQNQALSALLFLYREVPRTCWRAATISGPSRNCSATATCPPR
jgi:hypothetical protein